MHLRDFADEFAARDWDTGEPDGTVRLAMVGLGWWTREEAIPAVQASEYCETTVVVTSSEEKAARATGLADTIEHGITYDEFHDGAAADAYDAVYIVTPNALHLPKVETAADLGKDVLCEKPMEVDVDRAREMVDVCAAADVTLMIAYRMQTEPAVRRARDLVEAGAIGEPVLVHGTMSQRLLEMIPDPDQWRLDPDLSGGATVMDIGLYPLNTARFVVDADPVAVHAHSAAPSEPFADVGDEHVSFGLAFENGVHAACTASQNAYQASGLRVTGTEGELEINPAFYTDEPRALRFSRGGQTVDVDFAQVNQMTEEFDYFAHCLLTGARPHPDGEHGLVDMTVMDAIYEAAAREETVHLE